MLRRTTAQHGISLTFAYDRYAQLIGQGKHFWLFQHDGATRLQNQRCSAGLLQIVQRFFAHGGHVKAYVLIGIAGLAQNPAAAAAQQTGSLNHAVN